MPVGAAANVARNYANMLNTHSQYSISPNNPEYHAVLGDKTMAVISRRHGPVQLHAHIMLASFDPVYGREFSLVQQEERPATRFPLAEEQRQHQGSENNAFAFLSDNYIHPDNLNPFSNTSIMYDANKPGKNHDRNERYSYSHKYSLGYNKKSETPNPTKNRGEDSIGAYKIVSMVKALEKRAKQYLSRFYRPNRAEESKDSGEKSYQGIGIGGVLYDDKRSNAYGNKTGQTGYKAEPAQAQYGQIQNFLNGTQNYDSTVKPYDAKNILSWPTLDEFMKWQEIKAKQAGTSPLEQTINLSFSRN